MRKSGLAIIVMAFTLQGCAGAIIYGESRKVSRDVLAPVVAAELPDNDTAAATTCILKGMTVAEVLSLPNSTAGKKPEALSALVRDVAMRDGVGACLAAAPRIAG
jgi:hypothetical protein